MWAQELGLDRLSGVFPLSDRCAEMGPIPINDDGGEQVELGHAVVLALARQVEPGRALQMLCLGMFHPSLVRSYRQARRCP